MTCHLVLLVGNGALGSACYECCVCISLSFCFLGVGAIFLLNFLSCWARVHCLLKQTALIHHLSKYRTSMEFSILLESVYLSKPAHFSGAHMPASPGRVLQCLPGISTENSLLSLHNSLFVKAHTWGMRDPELSSWLQERYHWWCKAK